MNLSNQPPESRIPRRTELTNLSMTSANRSKRIDSFMSVVDSRMSAAMTNIWMGFAVDHGVEQVVAAEPLLPVGRRVRLQQPGTRRRCLSRWSEDEPSLPSRLRGRWESASLCPACASPPANSASSQARHARLRLRGSTPGANRWCPANVVPSKPWMNRYMASFGQDPDEVRREESTTPSIGPTPQGDLHLVAPDDGRRPGRAPRRYVGHHAVARRGRSGP